MEGKLTNLYEKYRQLNVLYDTRLTAARSAKLDNLNTTISSRASQSTANSIYSKINAVNSRVSSCQTLLNQIKPKTDKIARVPTSGGSGKWRHLRYNAAGYKVTVSGAGVLRYLAFLSGSQLYSQMRLNIDGRWVSGILKPDHVGKEINIVGGGVRFNHYFKLYFYRISVETTAGYYYTLGD